MTRANRDERGSALIIASMVMVILTLLGISYLITAEDEGRIAISERSGSQAQFAAEAGIGLVRTWFNDPDATTGFEIPLATEVDRSLRWVDHDQDGTYQAYSSAPAPWNTTYRQTSNDLFEKPYRGLPRLTLLGTEDHPDLSIYRDTASTAMKTYMDGLNDALFGEFPSPSLRVRIERIDVYGPPLVDIGGTPTRYGMGTVKVTAQAVQFPGTTDERVLSTRTVRAVLNEIPYMGPAGPVQSCDDLRANGEFRAHWGEVTVDDFADLASNLDNKLDSGLPWFDLDNIFEDDNDGDGSDDDCNSDGVSDIDAFLFNSDNSVEDPWLTVSIFGTLGGLSFTPPTLPGSQPYPYGWQYYSAPSGCDPPTHVNPDADHSNIFIETGIERCPDFNYALWKSIARSGFRGVHYYEWDGASSGFREDGTGPLTDVETATASNAGLFFFDTTDGRAPEDGDLDGTYDNLTPSFTISGSGWWSGGFIYHNAFKFATSGLGNVPTRNMRAPGEPFQDMNGNRLYDSNEPFLRITYPADYTANNAAYTHNGDWQSQDDWGAAYTRLDDGPAQAQEIHMYGIIYTNGYWDANGNGQIFGSVVTKSGTPPATMVTGTPDVWFDESILKGKWPPRELQLPRVYISEWETQH